MTLLDYLSRCFSSLLETFCSPGGAGKASNILVCQQQENFDNSQR